LAHVLRRCAAAFLSLADQTFLQCPIRHLIDGSSPSLIRRWDEIIIKCVKGNELRHCCRQPVATLGLLIRSSHLPASMRTNLGLKAQSKPNFIQSRDLKFLWTMVTNSSGPVPSMNGVHRPCHLRRPCVIALARCARCVCDVPLRARVLINARL
jgi:hypothetical protein